MRKSYTQRSEYSLNPTGKRLLAFMDEKKTNLALALDVIQEKKLLELADLLGPHICVLKTHIDILEDFSPSFPFKLLEIAEKHKFLIFEDRKFADIGNTVKWQYGGGLYRIADWADITNAHSVPGPGIIEGMKQVGIARGRGLLLLAEMSSKGTLAKGNYTKDTVDFALNHLDFVIGFICTQKLTEEPALIHFSPGVNLGKKGDSLGQQYITPLHSIETLGNDVIIVGRGIYEEKDPLKMAEQYRREGWQGYLNRMKR